MVLFFVKTIDDQRVLFDENKENLNELVIEYPDVFGKNPKIGQSTFSPEVGELKMNGKLWLASEIGNGDKVIDIPSFKPNKNSVFGGMSIVTRKRKARVPSKNKKEDMMSNEETVVGASDGVAKKKRHRRSKEEMAALKGEVEVKKTTKKKVTKKPLAKVQELEVLVKTVMIMKNNIMFIYETGNTSSIAVGDAEILRVDPKTGASSKLF